MIDLQINTTLSLQTWVDPPHAGPGVDVRSRYADHFWIPVIGPTAMCLLRLLTRQVGHGDGATLVVVSDLVAELGVDHSTGPLEIELALGRLLDHGLVTGGGDRPVRVRPDLPYLSQVQVAQLVPRIAVAHRAALVLRESTVDALPDRPLSPRMLSLTATIDDLLTNPELDDRQLAHRWQHVMRLAEEARDEATLDWASPDLEVTLAEGQLCAQAMNEAVWAAQHLVAQEGHLPAEVRGTLNEAAAGLVDWVVSEFPSHDEIWDQSWLAATENEGSATFEGLLGLLDLDEGPEGEAEAG